MSKLSEEDLEELRRMVRSLCSEDTHTWLTRSTPQLDDRCACGEKTWMPGSGDKEQDDE